jgi:hypothetical protein
MITVDKSDGTEPVTVAPVVERLGIESVTQAAREAVHPGNDRLKRVQNPPPRPAG